MKRNSSTCSHPYSIVLAAWIWRQFHSPTTLLYTLGWHGEAKGNSQSHLLRVVGLRAPACAHQFQASSAANTNFSEPRVCDPTASSVLSPWSQGCWSCSWAVCA